MIGDINKKKSPKSLYQPSNDVIEMIKIIKRDYNTGIEILHKPWLELNNRSVIQDQNRGQMMMNAFVDTAVEDPNEAWKWRGTRSMARNKAIAMHANLTVNYLIPSYQAQNEKDEIDEDFSEVMRDIFKWLAEPINSNYQSSFLQVVFGMMSNPVTYLAADYFEVMQTIKERSDNGKIIKREILDEVLSGFKANLLGATQVLITNAYERNIQKQTAIIKRRYTDKAELEAKYGKHPNWQFVQTGIKSIYSDDDGLFYDIRDEDHPNLIAEEIWLNRRQDLEIPLVNGIYMGESNVEANLINHRDNNGAPKYNIVPFGYHRIGEHFFYYKSMMNALGWDNNLIDAMYEVTMNSELLQLEMPIAISGSDKVDSEVIFPNAVVSFEDKDTRVSPLLPPKNNAGAFNALNEIKNSMEEGSVNDTVAGQLPEASQKAYNVAQATANAKKMIGAVGKSLAESIVQFGDLAKDIIINHITIPEVDELVGGRMKLKYRSFLLDSNITEAGVGNRKIVFDDKLMGTLMSEEEKKMQNLMLLEQTGYPQKKNSIILVNPYLFAKFKYLTKVDVEEMFTRNSDYWQQVLPGLYNQLVNNPLVNQEKLLKKLLYSFFQSEADEFINENPIDEVVPQIPSNGGEQPANPNRAVENKVL